MYRVHLQVHPGPRNAGDTVEPESGERLEVVKGNDSDVVLIVRADIQRSDHKAREGLNLQPEAINAILGAICRVRGCGSFAGHPKERMALIIGAIEQRSDAADARS